MVQSHSPMRINGREHTMAKKQKAPTVNKRQIDKLFRQLELNREEIRQQYHLLRALPQSAGRVYQLRTWLSGSSEAQPREFQYA